MNHLFWDVLMFVILAGMVERRSPAAFWTCIMTSSAAILLVLVFVLGDVQTYRGLSGLDSAFTGVLAVMCLHERHLAPRSGLIDTAPLVLLAGLGVKMMCEAVTGAAIFVPSSSEVPLPLVHLAGMVCGLVTGLASVGQRRTSHVPTACSAILTACRHQSQGQF
jgi:hypothetical protein